VSILVMIYIKDRSSDLAFRRRLTVGRAWGHQEQRDGQTYRALNPPTTVLWVGIFFTYHDGVMASWRIGSTPRYLH